MYFQHFQYSVVNYNGKAAKSKQTNKSQASTGVYISGSVFLLLMLALFAFVVL